MLRITPLLERSLVEVPQRRDDGFLWGSELGSHPAKVMARILYGTRPEFTLDTLAAMEDGNMHEANTANRVMRFYNGTVHTNFPLFNKYWSCYADLVLDHGSFNPVVVEHKATDSKNWGRVYADDPGSAYAPVKSTHLCQLWLYGKLYEEQFGVKPNLTLVVRAWRHLCEVEVIQTATDHLILIGEMDHKPFERIVRINPGLLRSELEDWYTLQRIPETIYDVAGNPIDPATWYYPELRSAAAAGL